NGAGYEPSVPVASAPREAAPRNGDGATAQSPPGIKPPNDGAPRPLPPGAVQLTSAALRIAQNMQQSLTVPTATSFREIPVKLLEENRALINGYLKASEAGKLSFTHIIGWAIVRALKE